MRWSRAAVIVLVGWAAPAIADDMIAADPCVTVPPPPRDIALPRWIQGIAFDGQDIDLRGGRAMGLGVVATAMVGRGRFGLFGEAGVGILAADHPTETAGMYGTARLGGRLLVTSFEADGVFRVSLALDAGVGLDENWLHGADAFMRPNVFVGWTDLLGGDRHGMQLSIRLAASPKQGDAAVLRAVCHGPCAGVDDAPADFTIMILGGVASW
jgi:hypothetical protein